MSTKAEVQFLLSAKDTAGPVITRLQQQLATFGQTLRAGFNLNLGAQAANGLLALGRAARDYTRQAVDLADRIKDQSAALGIGTTSLQVYQLAIAEAGGSNETFTKAIENLNRALVNARAGSSDVADAFRTLGLDARELSRLPMAQRFEAIGQALNRSGGSIDGFSAAGKILGQERLPALTAALRNVATEGFDKFAQAASDAGRILGDDTISRLAEAKRELEIFENRLVVGAGEAIGRVNRFIQAAIRSPLAAISALYVGLPALKALTDPAPGKATVADPTPPPPALANAEQLAKARLEALEQARARVEADVGRTEIERRTELVRLLDEQAKILNGMVRTYDDVRNLDLGENLTAEQLARLRERNKLVAELEAIRSKSSSTAGVVTGRAARARDAVAGINDPSQNANALSIGQAAPTAINEYVAGLGTAGEQVAGTLQSSLGSAVQGISDAIYGWATGANNFFDVIRNLGASVLQQVLDTLVQIGVQQLINGNAAKAIAVSWKALTSGLRAADTAETIAAESAKAPFLAANAAAASASSFGISAVIGIAALAALLGAFVAKFNTGGLVTGPGTATSDSVPALLSNGEYVLSAAAVQRLGVQNVERLNRGGLVGVGVPIAGTRGRGTGDRAVNFIAVDNRREAARIARNSDAESQIVDLVRQRKYEVFG